MRPERQRFSYNNLLRSFKNKYTGKDTKDLKSACHKVSKSIFKNEFEFSDIRRGVANKRPVFHLSGLRDEIVAQKVSDNLNKTYNIKPMSRDDIIRQTRLLLEEKTPKTVLRADIKSFFNNCNKEAILRKLKRDKLCSSQTIFLLEEMLRKSEAAGASGLPPGLSISSALSEIYLIDLDMQMRAASGVYFYARFVDDILILCHDNVDLIKDFLQARLGEADLALNLTPRKNKTIHAIETNGTEKDEFDYLGYKFEVPLNYKKSKDLSIRISKSKIKSIKTRIVRSLIDYNKNKDEKLFLDRLKFLSGSCPVYTRTRKSGGLRNGLCYSYQYISNFKDIESLDLFKSKCLTCKKGSFYNLHTRHLPRTAMEKACSISFVKSFHNKRYYGFSLQRLSKIKEALR